MVPFIFAVLSLLLTENAGTLVQTTNVAFNIIYRVVVVLWEGGSKVGDSKTFSIQ